MNPTEHVSDLFPIDCPEPDRLRKIRETMGLSQDELAKVLGFKENGADIVRAWEQGFRYGKPFGPTPLAWCALRMMAATQFAIICYDATGWDEAAHAAIAQLREALPEKLR